MRKQNLLPIIVIPKKGKAIATQQKNPSFTDRRESIFARLRDKSQRQFS